MMSPLSPDQINAWVQSYESRGKLPDTKVPCSSGCGTPTTMFADNLHKRVAKFGGIRTLLETFLCQACRRNEKTASRQPVRFQAPPPRVSPSHPAAGSQPAAPNLESAHPKSLDPVEIFSLHQFPDLPPFLQQHRADIVAVSAQVLPTWSSAYDQFDHPVMVKLRAVFPQRILGRADVLGLYQQWRDPLLCLIATMVWGGIRPEHLNLLLAMGEPVLESLMQRLLPLVRSGAWERAFQECGKGGPGKMDGVDYPYFTKVFFFMGQITPVLNPAPLILDKWSANAFLVLGRQICERYAWDNLFNLEPLLQGDPALLKPHRVDGMLYRIYVAWFNHWAGLLGVTAEALERYVFGISRRAATGGLPSNPRNALTALGKSLFS